MRTCTTDEILEMKRRAWNEGHYWGKLEDRTTVDGVAVQRKNPYELPEKLTLEEWLTTVEGYECVGGDAKAHLIALVRAGAMMRTPLVHGSVIGMSWDKQIEAMGCQP